VPEIELSSNPSHFLLERISPAVRKLLVKERIKAMKGGIAASVDALADAVRLVDTDRPRDVVALGLLHAELLHLDVLDDGALAVMEEVVTPHLASLTAVERFSVEQNRSDLQFYLPGAATALFYNIVDQKRLLNFEWLDYCDLFAAEQDARRERHFDTLPILWQQHRRAYLHGCWFAQRVTNYLLARECVNQKEWEDAIRHAVLSHDEDLLKGIADGILSARRSELMDRVVSKLLSTANLRRHFVVACKLFKALADAIPDGSIQSVGTWLLKRASEPGDICLSAAHFSIAWETIAVVGARFPAKLAQETVAVAIHHPIWTAKYADPNRFSRRRKEIVQAMASLSTVISSEEIPELATATLPLLLDRPQIPDYDDVVRLLCCLANRGGPELRDLLAASLYPPGQPVSRPLLQVAQVFGKGESFAPTRLEKLADQVVQEIRRQVQWLEAGQSAEPVGEIVAEFSSPKQNRTLKVYVVSLVGLHSLAKQRTKLPAPTIEKLVNAILDMGQNQDNFCVNRASLLRALIEFTDSVPPATRADAMASLEPLARGVVRESSEYSTSAETENPLNPTKAHSGKPEDVQGMALVALAALASGERATSRRVVEILEEAICDERPQIRRAAYAAARRLPKVSEGVVLGVLSGLRDPDPNAAGSAFAALTERTDWTMTRNHWRVFLMAAQFAQRTGSPNLRRLVAQALLAWSSKCPPALAREQAELLAKLSEDICWSVRSVLNRQDEVG
jgi:hypothetical protein